MSSTLEVTWSDEWDVAQADSDIALPRTLRPTTTGQEQTEASIGSIESLWFFTRLKNSSSEGTSEENGSTEAKSTPLLLNIHCSLSDASIQVLCSARYIEVYTFLCEPKSETIHSTNYVNTTRGFISPQFPAWQHMYLHEISLKSLASTPVDGIQLKFLSLKNALVYPEALLKQEPQLAEQSGVFRVLHVTKLEIHGSKASTPKMAVHAPNPPPSTKEDMNGNMMLAMFMSSLGASPSALGAPASRSTPQPNQPMPRPTPTPTPAFDHGQIPPAGTNSQAPRGYFVPGTGAPTPTSSQAAPIRPGVSPSQPPLSLPSLHQLQQQQHQQQQQQQQQQQLVAMQGMFDQMQTQLLQQLTERLSSVCQPLQHRLMRLEDKLDLLATRIASHHPTTASTASTPSDGDAHPSPSSSTPEEATVRHLQDLHRDIATQVAALQLAAMASSNTHQPDINPKVKDDVDEDVTIENQQLSVDDR